LGAAIPLGGQAKAAAEDYQAYCLYQAGQDYPDGNPVFDQNVQGIGHDSANWYITQTEHLWRIPVHHALGSVDEDDSGVIHRTVEDYGDIRDLGYAHFARSSVTPWTGSSCSKRRSPR
jgi:hypothetical protein